MKKRLVFFPISMDNDRIILVKYGRKKKWDLIQQDIEVDQASVIEVAKDILKDKLNIYEDRITDVSLLKETSEKVFVVAYLHGRYLNPQAPFHKVRWGYIDDIEKYEIQYKQWPKIVRRYMELYRKELIK